MVLGRLRDVYNSPANSDNYGLNPLSYWDYMTALVSRYADSPPLGMWEPMSEAEASGCPTGLEEIDGCYGHQTCPDEAAAASALDYFFTTVGGRSTFSTRNISSKGDFSAGDNAERPTPITKAWARPRGSTS